MMHDRFIGSNERNIVLPFLPGDTQERFEESLKTQPNDWYYRNTPITYSLNEYGHRSKSIDDIDLSNYVLFTGCSHTTGIGLELEKTYPYIISQKLKCDYYNMSMPGTGIDIMEYNLLMWFSTVKQKPKMVFVQMPDHSRYCKMDVNRPSFFIESGSWVSDKEELEMVVNCENTGFFNARKHFIYENIKNVVDVPIDFFNVYGQLNSLSTVKMRSRDLARDLSHLGIKSNAVFAEHLLQHVQSNYTLD